MNFKTLLLFSCICLLLPFQLWGNTENYPFRAIELPILTSEIYDNYIILSTPRTGSTVTYAVCQYLLEDTLDVFFSFDKKVIKTHHVKSCKDFLTDHENTLIIIPIRDPTSAFISHVKVQNWKIFKSVSALLQDHKLRWEKLLDFIENSEKNTLLFLSYEKLDDNPLYIANQIASKLGTTIPSQGEEKIKTLFSKKYIAKYTNKYKSFEQFDLVTGFHGNHISINKSISEKQIEEAPLLLSNIKVKLHSLDLL